jgi:hypothetical protein
MIDDLAIDWAIDDWRSTQLIAHRGIGSPRFRSDAEILDQITRSSFIDHHIDRQSSIIDRR